MCSPAVIPLVMSVAGGIMSASAQKKAGEAQKRYYDYLAGQNERQAKDVIKAGEQQTTFIQDAATGETKSLRASQRQFAGSQKVALAANGVPLSSVSVEDLARDTFKKEEMDAEALRYNADTQAYEVQMQARNQAISLRDQASGYRMGGANAQQAGNLNAATSLLGTATSVANQWYGYRQTSGGRIVTPPKGR